MKLVTFRAAPQDAPRFGALMGGDLIDLGAADAARRGSKDGEPLPASLRAYITRYGNDLGPLKNLLEWVGRDGAGAVSHRLRYALSDVVLLPPIPDPGKFLCVGKNNKEHLEELRRNQMLKETPTEPTGFIKLNSALVGSGAKVARPREIVEFDYEPEMVFVISRPGYRVAKADAMNHVFGITLLNDLTAREIQKREVASGTRFWTAKNMPGFGPVGPCVVTLDEIGDPQDLWLTCSVNERLRMRVHTGGQIFQIPDIIEHYSRHISIEPGDMFSTGSAGGVAVAQPNAHELFLKPGDVVDVACDRIGTLRTFIIA